MASAILDRELKKGSAELLILSLVGDRPRHGYEIGQLIEMRSRRGAPFQCRLSLSAPLPPRETRVDSGALGGKSGAAPAALLPANARGQENFGGTTGWLAGVRRPPSARSREFNMPDFKEEIRKRLAELNLSPTRENEIVEELSQHLEDQYEQAVRGARDRSRKPTRRCCAS